MLVYGYTIIVIGLAYDNYYKRETMPDMEDGDKKKEEIIAVSIAGPLAFWVGILIIAALLQLAAIPFANSYKHTAFNVYFNDFANYAIYIPGIIVLPLIVSLWIGDRVSYLDRKKSFVAYKGLVNALYTAIVYTVSIFIIYIIMQSQNVGVLSSFNYIKFGEYLVLIPIAINIVMIPLFALLSSARRYS